MESGPDAIVPFRFECHRCGRCCTHGDGYVWLGEGEAERLAEALDRDPEVFRRDSCATVRDPRTGRLRETLRLDESGRCPLLEGGNQCTAYAARPEHCSRFPFWGSVLEERRGFERAEAICPGIERQVDPGARERAFEELAQLYREVEAVVARSRSVCLARGQCCRFEDAGHDLYATALEADYAAQLEPTAPEPEAPGRCAYHVGGRCTAREGRPLGCRTYFCDPQTQPALESEHEAFLARIREIAARAGYSPAYAPFPELLSRRGVGAPSESQPTSPDPGPRGPANDEDL